jgi:L-lactate dehydrogenase (cytochrome)
MTSIGDYFTQMLDNSLDWKGVEKINKKWGKQFAIKGIMSVDDAKKAVDVGATCVMVSNHGGRQLDGARSPFDQLAEIVDAVGDKVDVVFKGGSSKSLTGSPETILNVFPQLAHSSSSPSTLDSLKKV